MRVVSYEITTSAVSYRPAFPSWEMAPVAISPSGRWERGAGNIREFGIAPPKYGGFQVGVAKFRRRASFRSAPWCSAVSLCLVGSFAFRRLPQLRVRKWGGGRLGYLRIRKEPAKIWRTPEPRCQI